MAVWGALGLNLAVVGLFISLWVNAASLFTSVPRHSRHLLLGGLMGAAAVASMLNAVQLAPGWLIDLRNSVVLAAGFFGGPIAAITSAVIAIATRVTIGGPGAFAGSMTILGAAIVGVLGRLVAGRRPGWRHIVGLAGAGALVVLGSFLLFPAPARTTVDNYLVPLAIITFAANLVIGVVLCRAQRLSDERGTLLAALHQAPDFLYVKDVYHRFIATNENTARHHGYSSPSELVGLSDDDLTDADRARRLRVEEDRILSSGETLRNSEESVVEKDGVHVYKTTKVPLRDSDGAIIGLAGVTRDVTERRQLERELRESRDLLSAVTGEMSAGTALFSQDGTLLFCNALYQSFFPLTAELRIRGANLADILRASGERGEQVNVPASVEGWIGATLMGLTIGGEEEVALFDGRWLQVRTRPTAGGTAVVVVTDISALKRNEASASALASDLRVLADTDGLTGLMNRRTFDAALIQELERTAAAGVPISLLIIDVDYFKDFNDRFGHQAGDECLKLVARMVRNGLRQVDTAARYGGEEFVAILPGADLSQALPIADRLRNAVATSSLPHPRKLAGGLTISIGLAGYAGNEARLSSQLLSRADQALYAAKEAGRNRVVIWQAGNGTAARGKDASPYH